MLRQKRFRDCETFFVLDDKFKVGKFKVLLCVNQTGISFCNVIPGLTRIS
ncbi:MAG: hypothetical protein JWP12_1251 [Bacteroidetes bacterium]|nr:hypothetical protein [Bacteroidota bacterium]